jgi:hypothetical protein
MHIKYIHRLIITAAPYLLVASAIGATLPTEDQIKGIKTLCGGESLESASFVAESLGMANIPRIKPPHPVAGAGKVNMQKIAKEIAPQVIRALEAVSD